MKNLVASVALILALVISGFKVGSSLEDPAKVERANALYKKVLCLTCSGEYVYESQSEFASKVRKQIDDKILAGNSDQEIIDHLKKIYGPGITDSNLRPAYAALLITAAFVLFCCWFSLQHYIKAPFSSRS